MSLTESLRRALSELDAAAIGIARADGGAPKYFTRSAAAAGFFEDICGAGALALEGLARNAQGVIGANHVRAQADGPIRGRLIAAPLFDADGSSLGLLVTVRLIDQPKFGARESQLLLTLVPQIARAAAQQKSIPTPPAPTSRAATPPASGPPPAAAPYGVWPLPSAPSEPVTASHPDHTSTAAPVVIEPRVKPAAPEPNDPDHTITATRVPSSLAKPDHAATGAPVTSAWVKPARGPDTFVPPAKADQATATPIPSAWTKPVAPPRQDHASTGAPVASAWTKPTGNLSDDEDSRVHPQTGQQRAPETSTARLLSWADFEQQVRAVELQEYLAGCVLYGDVDQLHVFNKLSGFAAGDQAIAEVGRALEDASLPASSRACHLSGDRFTVYVPKTTLAQGRRIAEQLCDAVSARSIELHGVATHLSISFGVATIPSNEGGLGHALAAAEAACKAAKDRGRGRVEVYQDADQSIVRRNDDVLVAGRLRQALEAGRIEVFAQPIVRLNGSGPHTHYELLVRLIGESGARLSPASFMSAATRYQMLVELDRAVLAHVFNKLEGARNYLAARRLRFSVNLSGPTIGDPDFLEWAASRIGGTVPGEWLQFEITETAAVANVAQTQAMIRRLKARGVQFALDDFGTGVSSFAYLKFFDVKMLKLDGAFVLDLLGNPRSESLVRGIAQLGRGMGFETVAECVETADVRDRLAELGIDCAQGFLFGRPQPLDGVLAIP